MTERKDIDLDRLDASLLKELERQVAAGETTREEADRIAATIRGDATKQKETAMNQDAVDYHAAQLAAHLGQRSFEAVWQACLPIGASGARRRLRLHRASSRPPPSRRRRARACSASARGTTISWMPA